MCVCVCVCVYKYTYIYIYTYIRLPQLEVATEELKKQALQEVLKNFDTEQERISRRLVSSGDAWLLIYMCVSVFYVYKYTCV